MSTTTYVAMENNKKYQLFSIENCLICSYRLFVQLTIGSRYWTSTISTSPRILMYLASLTSQRWLNVVYSFSLTYT